MHAWTQTIDIHSDKVTKLIENQLHLPVETIVLLDEGWDNLVYLINQKLIFRFPRRELGAICIENEINLLPFIAKQISFPLSNPDWIGHPSASYPYPFAGYRMLIGKPLSDARLILINDPSFAKILAGWLKELHSIEISIDQATLIKGEQAWRLSVNHRKKKCLENLSRYTNFYSQAGFNQKDLMRIIELLSCLKIESKKRCFLHGDLYSRHIIVDEMNLSPVGLIDWGDIHIGPPGIDLAVSMIFNEHTLPVFLNAYGPIDEEDIHIMLLHAFCHSMSFLPYAYSQNKTSLKQWASLALGRASNEILKLNM